MRTDEMQVHLTSIINRFRLRTDLINKLYMNPNTYVFYDDINDNDKWDYYNEVCKKLGIKEKVVKCHGMKSSQASKKKNKGHEDEHGFELFGLETKSGTEKTDLTKNGVSYASLKGGKKSQWGMHMIHRLPERFQELFSEWILTYEKKIVYLSKDWEEREKLANKIINKLNDRKIRYDLINWFLRKDENIPYLIIIKDMVEKIYWRVDYKELIDVIVDNITFYTTKETVKIVAQMVINDKSKVVFEIESRSSKQNAILMHGKTKPIINIIKDHNIDVKEEYKFQ